MKLKALLAGVVFASTFTTASALSVVTGNHPQNPQSNLVFNPCGPAVGTGLGNPVFGCLENDHTILVGLSSNEDLVITGGQASLDSDDGTFARLTITLSPLSSVILNIDATQDGFVQFNDGAAFADPLFLDGNGENFFTITGITGNILTFRTVNGDGVETEIVADVKQIRLGQSTVPSIPEPETYALMMAGLAAIGFIARRRKTQR